MKIKEGYRFNADAEVGQTVEQLPAGMWDKAQDPEWVIHFFVGTTLQRVACWPESRIRGCRVESMTA